MMEKVSGVLVRNLRKVSDLGSISQKGLELDLRTAVPLRLYSQSATSNEGSGDTKQDGTNESTSTSEPKKSRTGGDMTDEGQVHTPNLQKMRSTKDLIQGKGKETQERLASEKKTT